MKKITKKQSISGKVTQISSIGGLVGIEGVGVYPIPYYLIQKVKVGRNYELILDYSPFLNCIAIMEVKKVISFKSITDLVVDSIKNRNIPLFN